MAFLIYERLNNNGADLLRATGKRFSLAGYNLIYYAWQKRGKPTNQGWRVDANELIQIYSEGKNSYEDLRLIIDFDPGSTKRIALIELLEIYVYSYEAGNSSRASWSPMMLKIRTVYYDDGYEHITKEEKNKKISEFPANYSEEDTVEFLYLRGDREGWNWGSNGRTNAAFISGDARKIF